MAVLQARRALEAVPRAARAALLQREAGLGAPQAAPVLAQALRAGVVRAADRPVGAGCADRLDAAGAAGQDKNGIFAQA